MPGGDGTGPAGQGPMTGRAAGPCAGYEVPGGYANPIPGWAGFWGFGRGRGWRNRYYATGLAGWQRAAGWAPGGAVQPNWPGGPIPTREQEISTLKDQAGYFEEALADIRDRIKELEAKK